MNSTVKPSIRSIAKWIWVCFLFASGALRLARRELSRKRATLVLMLHRVLPAELMTRTASLPGMHIRQSTFHEMLRHIVMHYTVIDLARAVAPFAGPTDPKLHIALTFDDGWFDTAQYALPAMRAFGVTATVFVCPDLLGRTLPFWPERVLTGLRGKGICLNADRAEALIEKLKRVGQRRRDRLIRRFTAAPGSAQATAGSTVVDAAMDWNDVKEMAAEGLAIGSHTCTHPILTQISPLQVRRELEASKAAIATVIGGECNMLSYPNGDTSAAVRQMARLAGYELGFTTGPGAWTAEADPLSVPRCNISDENVIDPRGRFSRLMFQYATIWIAYRALRSGPKAATQPGAQRCESPATVERTSC